VADDVSAHEFTLCMLTCQLFGNRKSAENTQKGKKFFVVLLMGKYKTSIYTIIYQYIRIFHTIVHPINYAQVPMFSTILKVIYNDFHIILE